jgi:tetratricopeptide (TPR) repeat protein
MADSLTQNELILNRAKAAVLSRDYTLAARLYKGMLRSDPENKKLLEELGNLFVKSNQDDRALPLYKEIVRLDSGNLNALNSLGGIYRRLKKYEESIAVLEQALVVDENNAQVYYNLGFTYKLMGKYDDAIQCFETVVDENPNDVLAFNHIGSIYSLTNQNEKAVASYQRGLKIDPNHPILHLNLAKSYEQLKKIDKAAQEYEAALRSKPGWLDAIDGYADLLLKKNKTKDAGDLVKQAIRLNPKNAKMHTKMGSVYSKQSAYDNAETEFNSALDIEPKNEKALSGLADVYEANGKNNDAIRTMKKIEEIKPGDSSMLKQYSHILLTANKLNAASRKIKEVWDQNPDDVQTLNLLGQYYICRGDNSKALGCYKKIESIDPSYTDHYRDGAGRYCQIGQYNKAEKYCLKYLETNPNDPIGLSLLAADYENLDRYAEALDYYRRSAAADKDNVSYQKGIERANARLTAPVTTAQIPQPEEESADPNEDFSLDQSLEIKMDGKDSEFEDPTLDEDIAPEAEDDEELVKDNDKFDFESLTQQDTKPEDVFNPEFLDENAADVENEQEENKDLDDLVPEDDPLEDESKFFDDNPFGSKGETSNNGPEEDDMLPEFESENIDDDAQSKNKPISMDDGNAPEEEELDDASAVDDDDFSDVFSKKQPEPKAPSAPKPNAPDYTPEPVLDDEDADEPAEFDFEPLDEPAVEEEPVAPEEMTPAEEPAVEEEPVAPEEMTPAEEPAVEEEPAAPEEMTPAEEQAVEEEPVAPEEMTPAEEPAVEEEPVAPEEMTPAEEAPTFEEEPVAPEEMTPAEEAPTFEEEPVAPEDMDDVSNEAPIDDTEPLVLDEPPVPDIPVEDIMSSPEEKDITPEELNESIPQPDEEIPASSDDVSLPTEPTEDQIESAPTTEELFNKATATLPDIVNAMVDRNVVDKFSLTAEMFEKLRALSNYLPPEKKTAFLASKTHLLLEYIISRLNGKPGLLATAAALRRELNIEDGMPTEETGTVLVSQVFTNMRTLIKELPDKNVAHSLDGAVEQTLNKLS